jgi:CheY-like chemotaxis protein
VYRIDAAVPIKSNTVWEAGEKMNTEQIQSDVNLSDVPVSYRWIARPKKNLPAIYPVSQHRILCVDDEVVGTQLRGEIIEEHGYSVVLSHCPLTALQQDLSVFSLSIVDFTMPGMNGRELLLRMRALGTRFPIVLLTGALDALSYEDRVLFARCIDKSKPTQCLLETIDEFLGPDQIPDFGSLI